MTPTALDHAMVARFSDQLGRLVPRLEDIGVAVSGGPDSLALLLLVRAVCTGRVAAATVDHGLREGSRTEAEAVGALCRELGVSHDILQPDWPEPPTSAIQEKARVARYDALGQWASAVGIRCLLTAHHADDQAETLLMRLARGAGVRGLAAMRDVSPLPGHSEIKLVRPLLGWRKSELNAVCIAAGLQPVDDTSNRDPAFERVRTRTFLNEAEWLDPAVLARSASNLSDADMALEWATDRVWLNAVEITGSIAQYSPDAPMEIHRRILIRILNRLATEGAGEPRGEEIRRLLDVLCSGGSATLRGVACAGGNFWRFSPAPARKQASGTTPG